MSTSENPMIISALLWFDGKLDRAALVALLRPWVGAEPSWSRRLVVPKLGWGRPRWRALDGFDPGHQVNSIQLPKPADVRALEQQLNALLNTPLPTDAPLWQLHLIEGLDSGSALVLRLHHCVADGNRLIALLEALGGTQADIGGATRRPAEARTTQSEQDGVRRGGNTSHGWRRRGGAYAGRLAEQLAPLKLLFRSPATESALSAPLGQRKHVAFSRRIELEPLLQSARSRGVHLTALLLAAVTATLERWMKPRGGWRGGAPRALLPISLRVESDSRDVNHFASVFVTLPVGLSDPTARAVRAQAELDRLKAHHQARAWLGWVRAAGLSTRAMEAPAVRLLSRKASVTVSSIRGPEVTLQFGECPLTDVLVFAPTAGHVALSVTLLSYAGGIRVGVLADARIVPDPHVLSALLESELACLSLPSDSVRLSPRAAGGVAMRG